MSYFGVLILVFHEKTPPLLRKPPRCLRTKAFFESGNYEWIPVDIYMKIVGSPEKVEHPKRNQFFIDTLIGDHDIVMNDHGHHKQLILTTSVFGENRTKLYVNWDNKSVRAYIIRLLEHLSKYWPEVESSVLRHYPSPFKPRKENVVFTLKVFSPNIKDIIYYLGNVLNSDYKNKKIFIHSENNKIYDSQIVDIKIFKPEKHKEYGELLILSTSDIIVQDKNDKKVVQRNYPKWVIARLEVIPCDNNGFEISCYADYDVHKIDETLRGLESIIKLTYPKMGNEGGRESSVSELYKRRFEVFVRLKKENPHWTQVRLALEASKELHEEITEDTVRNVYDKMDETWVPGRRTR
jgi:hypothetical protein